MKLVTIMAIFVFAFFKFAWSYRLFNYVAILIGGMPLASQRGTPETDCTLFPELPSAMWLGGVAGSSTCLMVTTICIVTRRPRAPRPAP